MPDPAGEGAPISAAHASANRKARIAGFLFIVTFVTSIPALLLFDPVLNGDGYIVGPGEDGQIRLAALLEVLLAISGIGTAVVLFPVLKRQSETLALSYVASRTVESTMIVVGLMSLLTIVTLRDEIGGSGASESLTQIGEALVAVKDWTFLMGPGFCVAVNDMVLGYLLYRSGLVPRGLATLGLVGGALIFASSVAVLFGAYEQTEGPSMVATIPVFFFEAGLGIYMLTKGFRRSPILE